MNKQLLALILTGFVGSAHAGDAAIGYISLINMPTDGSFVRIELDETSVKNPSNCPAADFYIVELDEESRGSDRFLSVLLAASMENTQVQLWIEGCSTRSYWDHRRPLARDIYIWPSVKQTRPAQ